MWVKDVGRLVALLLPAAVEALPLSPPFSPVRISPCHGTDPRLLLAPHLTYSPCHYRLRTYKFYLKVQC
ncbi:hypothetical protein L2E82_45317 [Cichorium intybus]|uniref:Uncharacterized protein n=1 Tax=Cichorium intybus TaxID=13427 RepID=A0ACB8ZTI0_CICIN|nr:hypothetical protein L2E82_45317 [Cichorium intybus]